MVVAAVLLGRYYLLSAASLQLPIITTTGHGGGSC